MASMSMAAHADATRLSPHPRPRSHSASPHVNPYAQTPDGSFSTISHYPTDYSDDDPFFGVDFSTEGGTPSFLEDSFAGRHQLDGQPHHNPASPTSHQHRTANHGMTAASGIAAGNSAYPLTPDLAKSPQQHRRGGAGLPTAPSWPASISPRELQRPFVATTAVRSNQGTLQLTPNGSSRSSDDGLPVSALESAQSPVVTVSDWGRGAVQPSQSVERAFAPDTRRRSHSVRSTPGGSVAVTPSDSFPTRGNGVSEWAGSTTPNRQGLDPLQRPRTAVDSVNDLASQREKQERKKVVDDWLKDGADEGRPSAPLAEGPIVDIPSADNHVDDGIPLGDVTENKYEPGQAYFSPNPQRAELTPEDLEIIHSTRVWADAPRVHAITRNGAPPTQPPTAQAAMALHERLCRDTESVVSVAATWGTRRHSVPSVADLDIDGLSGNILKRLTISRTEPRKPGGSGLLSGFRTLVRMPSATLKRAGSNHDESGFKAAEGEKQDIIARVVPTSRTSSWGKKPTPSINTAIVSMGRSVAAVGAGQAHGRSGSTSATSVTSPKSHFQSLAVKTTLRRPRSKSDLPRPGGRINSCIDSSHSSLVGLWKKTGGPPVASLAASTMILGPDSVDPDDDDDDDDDDDGSSEGSGLKAHASNVIDSVSPTFEGFKSHVELLNPNIPPYLADRIAHQQLTRYKTLLNLKLQHIRQGENCPSRPLRCIALGGSARILGPKGESRTLDLLASPDSAVTPVENFISPDNFPQDVPMPPATSLPAELECQLCFKVREFRKPSDWTKHVHEDVQPFTCTWERCKDPKIFKRKADWVRHENEGHRHLEWWQCDVDDCTHVCYRRDNFFQHLIREHKIEEPKVKSKAAHMRAGGNDPVWQRVERCHHETDKKAHEEPCRFCGSVFPTWKKLTVHLAKHLEQISLPILRHVTARAVTVDTIISPVQDLPRPYPPLPLKEARTPPAHSASGSNNDHQRGQLMGELDSSPQNNQTSLYDFGPSSNSLQGAYLGQFGDATISADGAGYDGQQQSYLKTNDFQPMPVPGIPRVQTLPVKPNHYLADKNGYLTPTMAPAIANFAPEMHLSQAYGMAFEEPAMTEKAVSRYTPQESISPYSISPNLGSGYYQG